MLGLENNFGLYRINTKINCIFAWLNIKTERKTNGREKKADN
jgi:hypothetical protein